MINEGDLVLIPKNIFHRTAGEGGLRFMVHFSEAFLEPLSCCLRELYGVKNRKVVFCLNDNICDGVDTSWIWDSNLKSLAGFENKIYVSANRFDDMALRLKYANVNPSLIVMEGSIKNAIQCCYWELEKNETMLILTTPSLVDFIYETLKK